MTKFINELNYDKKPYDVFDRNPAKIGYVNDLAESVDAQVATLTALATNIVSYVYPVAGDDITGVTAPTVGYSMVLPAGTPDSIIELDVFLGKSASNSAVAEIYINTTPDLADAVLLATANLQTATKFAGIFRKISFRSGTLSVIDQGTAYFTDTTASTVGSVGITIDPTKDTYFIIAFTNAAVGVSSRFEYGKLTVHKA